MWCLLLCIASRRGPARHSFIGRYATYTGAGFQEGVSLSCVDEVIRLRKYAYGACEMLLNKFKVGVRAGVWVIGVAWCARLRKVSLRRLRNSPLFSSRLLWSVGVDFRVRVMHQRTWANSGACEVLLNKFRPIQGSDFDVSKVLSPVSSFRQLGTSALSRSVLPVADNSPALVAAEPCGGPVTSLFVLLAYRYPACFFFAVWNPTRSRLFHDRSLCCLQSFCVLIFVQCATEADSRACNPAFL